MLTSPSHSWPDSATIMERSRGIFFSRWEELLQLRHKVMTTLDAEDIHDLRVASRRFRAALELFNPFAPQGSTTGLKKSIRTLTRVLGELRNLDEALLFFRNHAAADEPADSTLIRTLTAQAGKEREKVRLTLQSFNHEEFDRAVRSIGAGLHETTHKGSSWKSPLAYFSETSITRFLAIHHLLQEAKTTKRRTSRHALRIAIKKWRYFLEIAAEVLQRDYTPLFDLLKEYQTLLGRLNDLAEFGALLEKVRLPEHELRSAGTVLNNEQAQLLDNLDELLKRSPLSCSCLL